MADVVVVGGGFGGLAAAARLAKLGHRVTVCERSDRLGGVARAVERDGFRWDAGPATTLLPAPIRDLFRKSGRPLERVVDLVPVQTPRRHVCDGVTVDLAMTGRAAQHAGLLAALGEEAATGWTALVDDFEPVWECLRTQALEAPYSGVRSLGASGLRTLRPWRTLHGHARRRLPEATARALLEHHCTVLGSDPRRTPWFVGVLAYVERTFGRWTCPGGMSRLTDGLVRRLGERKVAVRTGAEVVAVTTSGGAVGGVRLADGECLAADVVVSAVDARDLGIRLLDHPGGRREAARLGRPAPAPQVTHLGLRGPLPQLPHETVLHPTRAGEPTAVVRAPTDGSSAPPGHEAWTVLVHGPATDPLPLLAARGLDVRDRVVVRLDAGPTAYGLAWGSAGNAAAAALRRRPLLPHAPNQSEVHGLFRVGATAHPGGGLPFVALGAAAVAARIGKA